jgi:hypothetical protein
MIDRERCMFNSEWEDKCCLLKWVINSHVSCEVVKVLFQNSTIFDDFLEVNLNSVSYESGWIWNRAECFSVYHLNFCPAEQSQHVCKWVTASCESECENFQSNIYVGLAIHSSLRNVW